jgi:hypothetical protein
MEPGGSTQNDAEAAILEQRGRKRVGMGMVLGAVAILAWLLFAGWLAVGLDPGAGIMAFAIWVPMAWLVFNAVTWFAVSSRKPWAPLLAMVRCACTIVAVIWLALVTPLLYMVVISFPVLGLPLLGLYLLEVAAEIHFIRGGIDVWRARRTGD